MLIFLLFVSAVVLFEGTFSLWGEYLNEDSIRKLKHKLQNNWQNGLSQQNPSNAYNLFLNKFLSLYVETFPPIEHKIKQKSLVCPWITKDTAQSSKTKQHLHVKNLKKEQLFVRPPAKTIKNSLKPWNLNSEKIIIPNCF